MAKRIVRGLMAVDIEVLDDEYTDEMVRENGAIYLQCMIGDGQRANEARWGDDQTYRFNVESITLFAPETDYLLDLADLAAGRTTEEGQLLEIVTGLHRIAKETI